MKVDTKVYLNKYAIWFLVYFVISILPIVITIMCGVKNITLLFSSYLSYVFTLLIANSLLYYNYCRSDELDFMDICLWSAFFFALIIVAFYPLYNLKIEISNFINEYIIISIICMFSLNLLFSFLLNKPLIKRDIKDAIVKRQMTSASNIKNEMNSFKDTLEKEDQ